jgi:hypothetical protein
LRPRKRLASASTCGPSRISMRPRSSSQ